MEQLSGVDTSFLTMETATTYGHVGDVAVFDEGELTLGALRDLVEQRIHLLPAMRRRLVECRSASTGRTGSSTRTST